MCGGSQQPERQGAERHRILVVEDDATIREVLVTLLEDDGYEVCAAGHGRDALTLLHDRPADLILLDLMLPILDGRGFLAERRRLGIGTDVPAILVSASRRTVSDDHAGLGVAAVVTKPFDLDEILRVIERVLSDRLPQP
ncbi:MAG: response regulator [Chloroflexi bacterium]|nr:response regulator [Chloroflexota bacterium]